MKSTILEYKSYQGSVEISLKDGVMHGKILHIVDLVTYEAETITQLRQEFEAAVDDYLETCEEEGVQPDKPFSGTFNVRVGPETHRKVVKAAARAGMNLNETIKRVLETWLNECPEGFEVVHRHTHEHHLVHMKDDDAVYRGAMTLTARQQHNNPKVTLQ
ncbi:type II toxin-antitoxin system HicB family antitoxin [Phytohalomonas tamaricis]|uniref:type II toxin-antitoxin system HicB family antitoxin n=1 Tax=Phytohalomonas tamaricis TaxID=2081032 RepID=UPI000D0B6642|nr:type II toxin-antitoxin system HicB family antitoxin [Phytohalomonas tamaricis]